MNNVIVVPRQKAEFTDKTNKCSNTLILMSLKQKVHEKNHENIQHRAVEVKLIEDEPRRLLHL